MLLGLKENVIIGKLIPAATGMKRYRSVKLTYKGKSAEWDVEEGRGPAARVRSRGAQGARGDASHAAVAHRGGRAHRRGRRPRSSPTSTSTVDDARRGHRRAAAHDGASCSIAEEPAPIRGRRAGRAHAARHSSATVSRALTRPRTARATAAFTPRCRRLGRAVHVPFTRGRHARARSKSKDGGIYCGVHAKLAGQDVVSDTTSPPAPGASADPGASVCNEVRYARERGFDTPQVVC